MKTTPLLLAASAASLASAQTYNTSAPFTLELSSSNTTIDGQFLGACHSGAAIEALCLDGTNGTATDYNTFTLNVSTSSTGNAYETGILVWVLETGDFNVSSGLVFTPPLTSNVVAPEFEPGSEGIDLVGFDDDDNLFIYSSYVDDKTFTDGTFPTEITPYPLYQWYACWTFDLAYYYQTLAWVTGGVPNNPTCVAVNVTRNFI
ncbi:hypothetical protein M406DRAFT_354167 [Cryphonectria parasitica EP155]|uniref:DUF7907 domain-containing protein n=1 Tax=Cryphonectria parasitica (strain ATCC 38755 / EP155) TaxID=660469 RepID=A0A9P5CTX6_CRYP1|nr:uncharacterized protein M406DRAFT_354167 [Cryphonectria parasitica EP155]KAF3769896.1 hypothetical protein M406DRAFT_354167 [Cryphonectria parasitica EP155]